MNTQCHYLQAAAVMPGRYAAAVAQRQVAWLRSHPNTIDWVVLAAEPLARKLASEGEIDSALPLLDALLETRPPEGSGGRRRLMNRLYISQYHMRALANGPLKELAARAPTRTLSMLCGALERAQEGESSLWRTAIEPDGQNVEFDALAVVVDLTVPRCGTRAFPLGFRSLSLGCRRKIERNSTRSWAGPDGGRTPGTDRGTRTGGRTRRASPMSR